MLFLSYLKIRLDKKDLVKYKNILIYNLYQLIFLIYSKNILAYPNFLLS
jgi:hypothetical protein